MRIQAVVDLLCRLHGAELRHHEQALVLLPALGKVLIFNIGVLGELSRAVGELGSPIRRARCAVRQTAGARFELGGTAVKLSRAVSKLRDAIAQFLRAGAQLLRAVREAVDPVGEFPGAARQLAHAVVQFACAVGELGGGIRQLFHGSLEIVDRFRIVKVELLEQIIGNHGHRGQQFKILHVGFDDDVLGDVKIHRLAVFVLHFLEPEAVLEAGRRHADRDRFVPCVDDLAVGHRDIFRLAAVKHQAGDDQEWLIERDRLAVDHAADALVVLIIKGDDQVAGRARKGIGGHIFPVQRVGDARAHGQLLVGLALVVDVLAVRVPDQRAAAVAGKCLVPLDVFNVGEVGTVLQRRRAVRILEPGAHDRVRGLAGSVRDDVDGLFLARGVTMGAKEGIRRVNNLLRIITVIAIIAIIAIRIIAIRIIAIRIIAIRIIAIRIIAIRIIAIRTLM